MLFRSDGVTRIGPVAFGGDLNLTNVTLPDSLLSIGQSAFGACTNLANIKFDLKLNGIGDGAFIGCPLNSVTLPSGIGYIGLGAFSGSLISTLAIPASLTGMGYSAFDGCINLTGIFFQGNAPGLSSYPGEQYGNQYMANNAIIYYLPGKTNWLATFDGRPTKLWNPQAQTSGANFGLRTNRFGFNITGTTNIPMVVEACTNLGGAWTTLQSVSLTNGAFYFSDAEWTNYPGRFYRIRSP